jgi:hypothetical protein
MKERQGGREGERERETEWQRQRKREKREIDSALRNKDGKQTKIDKTTVASKFVITWFIFIFDTCCRQRI